VRISLICTPKPRLGSQPCTLYLTRTFGSIFNSRPPSPTPTHSVRVTGNAGKLKEVREILANGSQDPHPIEVESRDLVDR